MTEKSQPDETDWPQMASLLFLRFVHADGLPQEEKEILKYFLQQAASLARYEEEVLKNLCGQTQGFHRNWERVTRDNSYPWHAKTDDEYVHQIKKVFALNDITDKKTYFKQAYATQVNVVQHLGRSEAILGATRDVDKETDFIVIGRQGLHNLCRSENKAFLACVHEYGHHQMRDYYGEDMEAFIAVMQAIIDDENKPSFTKEIIEKHWMAGYGEQQPSSGHIIEIIMKLIEKRDKTLDFYTSSTEEALMHALERCSVSFLCCNAFSITDREFERGALDQESKYNAVHKQLYDYVCTYHGYDL